MSDGALDVLATKPHRERVDPALVRSAVDESGLSVRAISDKVGVAEKTISRWANGKSGLTPLAWPRFLELLGLPEKRRAELEKEAEHAT